MIRWVVIRGYYDQVGGHKGTLSRWVVVMISLGTYPCESDHISSFPCIPDLWRLHFVLIQVYDEVLRLRQQSKVTTTTTTNTTTPASLLRKVECERDDAKMELQQLKAETQSLKDRLGSLRDGRQHEMGELEDRIAELQLQLDEVRGWCALGWYVGMWVVMCSGWYVGGDVFWVVCG